MVSISRTRLVAARMASSASHAEQQQQQQLSRRSSSREEKLAVVGLDCCHRRIAADTTRLPDVIVYALKRSI